jgi:3',5'-cyclic AMP phosphodiesterase CpdA
VLRIAVISDLHVFSGSSNTGDCPSTIGTADPQDAPERHPFRGLAQLIEREGITADLLICPGDLSDKAEPSALIYAWNKLHELKDQLGAKRLMATTGNHDVDSRNQFNDHDPKGNLQSLVPMFPGIEEALCDRYWSRNFAIIEEQDVRIVLLNSTAFHGYGTSAQPEYNHGRISARTVSALRQALVNGEGRINIFVCHHHPVTHNPVEEADYSEMIGGDRLVEMLDSGDFGSWLLIHGHKHYPRLAYAAGGASSPVIFSAGSFSAFLYQKIASRTRNQFYILEIPLDELDALELDIAGTLTAWDWINMVGWQPAGPRSGLPHKVGFGWRESARTIANLIATYLSTTSAVVTGEELLTAIPKLRFLRPEEIDQVVRRLRTDHQVVAQVKDGMLFEVGRS